jgi:hypothetical protein
MDCDTCLIFFGPGSCGLRSASSSTSPTSGEFCLSSPRLAAEGPPERIHAVNAPFA